MAPLSNLKRDYVMSIGFVLIMLTLAVSVTALTYGVLRIGSFGPIESDKEKEITFPKNGSESKNH